MSLAYVENEYYDGIDFRQNNLAKGEYENCTFRNCQFAGCDLNAIIFVECSFQDCDFSMKFSNIKYGKKKIKDPYLGE